MDVGYIAAGFEQREAQRVLASQKSTAGQAAAVTDDPKTLPVAFDVEVIRQADTCRDKIGHAICQDCFRSSIKCPNLIRFLARSFPLLIKTT
jgi:hypothetical protein